MQTLLRPLFLLACLALAMVGFSQNDTLIDGLKKRRNKESPCSRYWNGTMKYTSEPYMGINITRKGRKQIETNTLTGQKTTFKVKWDGSCAYTLTFKKSNMPSRFKKGWEVKYEIYECYEEFYEWEANIHGIMSWGQVTKELSKSEKKAKQREAEQAARQARMDSIFAVKEAQRVAREDSIRKSKGLPTLAEEKAAKEKEAAAKAANPAPPIADAEEDDGGKKKKKGKGKQDEAGNDEAQKDDEGGKPAKEKKEKKPKKEKAPKAEKAPKEKKEKPEKEPKEKKEKPPKEEKPPKVKE